MTRLNGRATLALWQRRGVYIFAALLSLSGIVWLILENFVRVEGDFGPERLPIQHWMLMLHGVSAYLFLPLLGLVAGTHAVGAWRMDQNRGTGIALGGVLVTLGFTAVALYYMSGETARYTSSTVHWIIGLALPLILVAHIVWGRLGGRRARSGAVFTPDSN